GLCRRMVDEYRARCHARERALVTERDAAQVVVVAHARECEIRAVDGFARRARPASTVFGEPLLGFRPGPVVHGYVEAGFGQMPGHRMTHYAEAEKGDATHCIAVGGGG